MSFGKLMILYQWLFTRRATTAAIDVTNRCNLRCRHCYWWEQEHQEELSRAKMLGFMRSLRSKGLRAAILYGGEPTLRPELCRAAADIFDATLIFTNGTNGFAELPRAQWILSLDGPREVNDLIRGEGVYDLAVKNLAEAARPPIVHLTISWLNREVIEDFVREMLELPVKGIGFSFYTPLHSSRDARFFIPLGERDRVVSQLLLLRQKYGERIGFTGAMARQLLSNGDFSRWNNFSLCPVSTRVRSFRADGHAKKCTYGEAADCSRCGCAAVVAYRAAFKPFDYQSFKVICGLLFPAAGARRKNARTESALLRLADRENHQ